MARKGIKYRKEDQEMAELTHVSTNRKTIRDQVARHPIVAFTTLGYAISWIAWFLSSRFDLGVVDGIGIIGLAGPGLAAMLVSACLGPEPSGIPAGKRWRLFGISGILVLAVTAIVRLWCVAGLVTVTGIDATAVAFPTPMAFVFDVLAAAVVAFILSGVYSRRRGVRDLLRSLDPRHQPVRWYWWPVAVGLYPVVMALGSAISIGMGQPEPAPNAAGPSYWLAVDALIMFLYYLFAGGGLEEPGWRGFTLPLLQQRFSPLRSSLILAIIWAFWHWPLLQVGPLDMVVYLVLVVAPLAILFTAVFNRTRGSLAIVALLHVSINLTPTYLPESLPGTVLWLLLMVGIALWMWRSPQTFSYHRVENK
jgi:membrane protease YdiL (CAAX protease family)